MPKIMVAMAVIGMAAVLTTCHVEGMMMLTLMQTKCAALAVVVVKCS